MAKGEVSVVRVKNVLLVTLPSAPGDRIIDSLQSNVLSAMNEHRPDGVVIDISLVETVDSFFARTMEETAQMISLMGGRTVVAGMQPEVAVTATELGLSFGQAGTALNVESALDVFSRPEAKYFDTKEND